MGLNSQQEKNNGSKSMLGKKVPQFMYFSLSVAEPKKKKIDVSMKRINLLALQTTIKDSDFQRRSKTLLLKRLRLVSVKIIIKNILFYRNIIF